MRITVATAKRTVLDVELSAWKKRTPQKPADPGPTLRAAASCQSVERKGWTPRPATRALTFGFGRPS